MARKLRSPTRTISNRGDLPRFIGQFPCIKGVTSPLTFDSLSALLCGIYLEWRRDVVSIAFEPRVHHFPATGTLPELTFVPDYEVILTTGELELYEAKYSAEGLDPAERAKLKLTQAHCEASGIPYQIIFRKKLEEDGFIDTLLILRRFGQLSFPDAMVEETLSRLSHFTSAYLEDWRTRAHKAGVPTRLLYHLLYHQRLSLAYRPLLSVELLPCRA